MSEHDSAPPAETAPTLDQRRRLELWLQGLTSLCVQHQILIEQVDTDIRIIDRDRGTLIGLDLIVQIDEERGLLAIDPIDSILDGVWLVESANGPVEQRTTAAFRNHPPGSLE